MGNIRSLSGFFAMYVEGFKRMTWGKPLWVLIFIKVFLLFAVLKVFFFHDVLNSRFETEEEKSEFVFNELMDRK
jgi:hypothetical protein